MFYSKALSMQSKVALICLSVILSSNYARGYSIDEIYPGDSSDGDIVLTRDMIPTERVTPLEGLPLSELEEDVDSMVVLFGRHMVVTSEEEGRDHSSAVLSNYSRLGDDISSTVIIPLSDGDAYLQYVIDKSGVRFGKFQNSDSRAVGPHLECIGQGIFINRYSNGMLDSSSEITEESLANLFKTWEISSSSLNELAGRTETFSAMMSGCLVAAILADSNLSSLL
jgi:hypothetical protein